jgi:glycosyltransferase involved in cell wall biosynthesis
VLLAEAGAALTLAALARRKVPAMRLVAVVGGIDDDVSMATGLARADCIVCLNRDDAGRLGRGRGGPIVTIPGAGVDLAAFAPQPLPRLDAGLVFLMTAPLERRRGVLTFAAAARQVAAQAPGTRFRLLGEPVEVSDIAPGDLARLGGCLERLGTAGDRPTPAEHLAALAAAHVFVYPALAEGMPQPVLEALAAGRPVIAADVPGARETVDERVNGILVPLDDPDALAAAMLSFVSHPELVASAGRASRLKAERRFDGRTAMRDLLAALGVA